MLHKIIVSDEVENVFLVIDKRPSCPETEPEHVHAHSHPVEKSQPLIMELSGVRAQKRNKMWQNVCFKISAKSFKQDRATCNLPLSLYELHMTSDSERPRGQEGRVYLTADWLPERLMIKHRAPKQWSSAPILWFVISPNCKGYFWTANTHMHTLTDTHINKQTDTQTIWLAHPMRETICSTMCLLKVMITNSFCMTRKHTEKERVSYWAIRSSLGCWTRSCVCIIGWPVIIAPHITPQPPPWDIIMPKPIPR